jgi:GYF domain 2
MHSKAHYCFVVENGEQQGPLPPDKVQRMWRDGQITDAALVWREGLPEWQPISFILTRLASIRQKEYLKFVGYPTPRGMTFDEAQLQLDALVSDNPARKLAFERWDVLAQKRDEVLSYFERSQIKFPVSDFDVIPVLEKIEESNPKQFASIPSYEIARVFKSFRAVREWEDEPATDAQKNVLRSKRIPYDGLTKKQASDLIETIYNGATEGQVRRLNFYEIDSEGLSKKEACVVIDDYIASHPDAENDYQRWKMNGCPPISNRPQSAEGKTSGVRKWFTGLFH